MTIRKIFAVTVVAVLGMPTMAFAACPYDANCLDNPYGAGSPYTLMNDPTLGPLQKQRLVIRVQNRLEAYQATQTVKASKKASKQKERESTARIAGQVTADPKGLADRRKEFLLIEGTVKELAVSKKPQPAIAPTMVTLAAGTAHC